ncbi:beta-alanine-activating enzyme isoform X1 [Huso huso]|uniref:Beta-alanine-activating enzyme isoform X1 n=1 Tax=Huso huso TaxID=61971 RepID=A0ABR1A870_HUSHU
MEETSLHDLVQRAAHIHSDKIAVCFDDCSGATPVYISYNEVINGARELTSLLNIQCDINNRSVFGLYCQPGINLASWILGILQVPAAYVPVDPEAPPHLSAHVMMQCCLRYILIQRDFDLSKKFLNSFSTWLHCDAEVVLQNQNLTLLKLQWRETHNLGTANELQDRATEGQQQDTQTSKVDPSEPSVSVEQIDSRVPGCLAYVLHTSGTTGLPKIVRVPHRCIVPNILHLRAMFQITPEDVLFMASPLTFDPSVVELFVTLSSGASLLIIPSVVKMMPTKLAAVLFNHHRVSVMQATPTLVRQFGTSLLNSTVLSASTSLRILALGGEAFPTLAVLRNWRAKGNKTQFFNLYGITEVSSWATCYMIPDDIIDSTSRSEDSIPLGTPLLGTTVEVRDLNGSLIKQGEGKIFIGGRERLCFIGNEVTMPYGTMRETGDWVVLKESNVYYMGRKDSHIKRHGKRLNLETVQQTVESLSTVEACAVTYYKEHKLILFVVAASQCADGDKDIFLELVKFLPAHAMPDKLVMVESLPFTAHGKVNMKELVKVYEKQMEALKLHSGPQGKEELWACLLVLWKAVLSLPADAMILPESAFLFSGGDSLKSLRLSEEIEAMVGRTLPELMEVILNGSFLDLYNHIANFTFSSNDKETTEVNLKQELNKEFSSVEVQKRTVSHSYKEKAVSFTSMCRGGLVFKSDVDVPNKNSTALLSLKHVETRGHSDITHQHVNKAPASSTVHQVESADPLCPAEGHLFQKDLAGEGGLMLKMRWKSDTGKCVDASPLLLISGAGEASATVYIGSHSHRMQAIDLCSGMIKWERVLGDRIESSATVTKCGNFIVVGCYDSLVYVLRASDGKTYWTFSTGNSVKSCATVDPESGLVFIGSHDHHTYALDVETKQCVWKRHCGGGAVFSSPFLNSSPRQLYIATLGSQLLAINPDNGDILWKHSSDKPFFSSPQCTQRAVFIGSVDGNVYCFSHTGKKLWQFSTNGPIFSSPCIDNSSLADQKLVCGSHDNYVYCLKAGSELLWKFKTSAKVYSTPFIFSDHHIGSRSLVAVTSTDGKLWILDSESGVLKTSYSFPGETFSSPVVWGRTLIVGCRNNFVYCLELSGTD